MLNANLDIDSKSIEDLYDWFRNEIMVVNRRYQRKLVWSLDEKKALISSITADYPIPLLLFVRYEEKREILDGMQRLEAITSFIEQKYDLDGKYFDLDSTALTKDLKDKGVIEQKTPILPRDISTGFTRYKFAVSEYSAKNSDIDEVFRRINSNGKTLSKQELRSAGCLSNFSELVRKIAIIIRGDTSHSDILKLNNMSKISIGTDNLNYGVCINDHFYVTNGVLTRSCIRASDDEELVANILAYIALEEKPTSGSTSLDSYYGVHNTPFSSEQRQKLETYIQTKGEDKISESFIFVYETIKELFESSNTNFKTHILGQETSSKKSPRYFQAVFLALYETLIIEKMKIKDKAGLLTQLENTGNTTIQVTDGGRWAAQTRQKSVEDLKALILRHFEESDEKIINHAWITEIDNILTSSKTEQTNYDFKQGFIKLDGNHRFDDDCLDQVVATCVGINNISKESKGFVVIGISDKGSCSDRIKHLYDVDSIEKNGFYINGIDHEAMRLYGNLDDYFNAIKDKIKSKSFNEPLKQQILKDIKLYDYKDHHLIKIEVKSVGEVCSLDDTVYLRQGTSTDELKTMSEVIELTGNYNKGI
ncbi:DUF262 domain-containing protein [Vibrio owensii]|uniref:DUF262 domain-containing protein n=1 Tax=Vibrio owensii TaxID=696485 RepID=UPI00148C1C80|nr:DUF262 domain-containing protein [Vibrio owensii]NOI73125.1 DUF262 domain-containing protein [Vibrio owensii]